MRSSYKITGLLIFMGLSVLVSAQKFRPDDPVWTDPDHLNIPQPTSRPLSKTLDLLQKTFQRTPEGPSQAQNVNTLGEVPDSSWYNNRMSRRVLSVEELVKGSDRGEGPDMTQPWTIIAAKTEGVTPGFRIRDARGDVYFIKFDPLFWPQMATSAEVIGTKFFHAFGFNVPENYLVFWEPDYEVDTRAKVLWDSGHEDRLSPGYVREVMERVPVRPDGTIQVLASKLLPGKPLGPFDYQGTRSDDPNDIFVHQDRRELRALRLLAAWLNHNDSDSVNTLDMFHADGAGRQFVKHYLIDFGTVMGSGATQPHARRVGNEYYIEFKPALRSALTLGIWDRPWRKIHYDEFTSVGRFEAEHFKPEQWKPDYPNPAFDKMTAQDGLWAARMILRFSDDAVRAIVATGRIDDREAEEHMVGVLLKRRDKILRYALAQINPIDEFEIRSQDTGHSLRFSNLGVQAGLTASATYSYRWSVFDNQSLQRTELGAPEKTDKSELPVPDRGAAFLVVHISTEAPEHLLWKSGVDVYLRQVASGWEIVGIDRADPTP